MSGSISFEEMIDLETPEDRRREIREGLLSYCGRDTEALVLLFNKLLN